MKRNSYGANTNTELSNSKNNRVTFKQEDGNMML